MKKLYFIRHGLTVMNSQGLASGSTNTPLVDEGRTQAKRAGQQAKGLRIDLIVSSPLSRAIETAEIIAREIGYPAAKVLANDLLVERDLGELEGAPYQPGIPLENFAGVEHDDKLVKRAREALDWVESLPADNILIVAHGGIGRALRSLVKKDFPMSHPHRLGNAELHEWL